MIRLDAEQSVLGALLLDAGQLLPTLEILPAPEAFTVPFYRDVYRSLRRLSERREPVDPTTLRADLEAIGATIDMAALADLVDAVPTAANVTFHAKLVADAWRRRRLCSEAERLMKASLDPAIETDALMADTVTRLAQAHEIGVRAPLATIRDSVFTVMEQLEQEANRGIPIRGFSTGFDRFDDLTDGFQAGDQWVLAARTSRGKSSLGLQLARTIAVDGPVLYVSREMQEEKLVRRLMAAEARLNLRHLRDRAAFNVEVPRIAKAAGELLKLPLHFDTSSKTAEQIRFAAQCLKARLGSLALVVVDYLQLLKFSGSEATRNTQIGEATALFKETAMDLGTRFLVLSQLNRKGTDENEPPELYHLRDSGNIEQDADVVPMIHWPAGSPDRGATPVDLYIRKNRDGATGMIPLLFETWTGRWKSPESDHQYPLSPA